MADQFSRMYDVERVGGDQRTRLAEMLRAAGQNQPQGQMVSGWYVAPSWSQNLNTALSGALGTYMGIKLDEEKKQQVADILRGMKEGVPIEQPQMIQNFNRIEQLGEGQTTQEPQNQLQKILASQRPSADQTQANAAVMPIQKQQFRPQTQDEQDISLLKLAQLDPQTGAIYGNLLASRAAREEKRQQAIELEKLRQEGKMDYLRAAQMMKTPAAEPLVAVMGKDGSAQLVPRSQAVGMTPFNAQTAGTGTGTPVGRQREATEAVDIVLKAAPLVRQATSSGIGAAVDWAGGLIGKSASSADKAAELKVLGGMLVSKMPKMSGPQSDKDVLLYKEMAGRIGDPTVPASQKESALQTIYDLNAKYAGVPQQTLSFEPNSVMQGYSQQGTGVAGGDLANQAAQILEQRRKAGQ